VKTQPKVRASKRKAPRRSPSDRASRYLLLCEALESVREDPAIAAFEHLFRERGLPAAIRSDNGVPFASPNALFNLSVWWLRLGLVAAPRLVGLREVDEGIWLVTFMHDDLGHIDLEQKTFQPIHNPSGTRLSPMFQERGVTCVSGPDKRVLVAADGFEPPTKGL
jgi:hypothetical protein